MAIRRITIDCNMGDVVPQAIFSRPLDYFTLDYRQLNDGLDQYKGVTFEIGNWIRFDIRHYEGHPEFTTSLYLSIHLNNHEDIQHSIDRVVGEFALPRFAIAWRRGEAFEYGVLKRSEADRLREPEARLLVLKVASVMPNHRATTDELIEEATKFFVPSERDLRPSRTRPNQPQWHQIIRNVISHRGISLGPFRMGLATRTKNGLAVTEDGLDYLREHGFID